MPARLAADRPTSHAYASDDTFKYALGTNPTELLNLTQQRFLGELKDMSEERKVSRRTFISGTAGGLVVGAVAGAVAGYSVAPPPAPVGPPTTVTVTTTVAPAVTPIAKEVLRHGTFHDCWSFDPHKVSDEPTTRYTANVYDTLVRIAGVPPLWVDLEPHLAKDWRASPDGKEYTFTLKRGVKFHDGSTLDAKAVKYSFDRALTIKQCFAAFGIAPYVSSTEVLGDYEFRATLSKPYAPFMPNVALLYIVNPTVVEANKKAEGPYGGKGDYGTEWLESHDAGSGPYKVKERRVGEYTVFERHLEYFEGWGPQHFDEMRYEIVPEVPTVVSKLKKGELDWGEYWLPEDAFNELEKTPGCTVPEWLDTAGTFTILLNNQNPFLKNKALRQAINYAFDYETCINRILLGKAGPSTGPLPPGMLGYNPEVKMYTRDLTKAKALMEQSGLKAGEITLDITWTAGMETRRLISILLQENLAEIGINLELKELPWATIADQIAGKDPEDAFAMSQLSGSIAIPDPDDILSRFYYSRLWEVEGLKTYYTMSYYKNTTVDRLIEEARASTSVSERDAMYKEACKLIVEDAASLWPFWQMTRIAIRSDIEGWRPYPHHWSNWQNLRMSKWFRVKT